MRKRRDDGKNIKTIEHLITITTTKEKISKGIKKKNKKRRG